MIHCDVLKSAEDEREIVRMNGRKHRQEQEQEQEQDGTSCSDERMGRAMSREGEGRGQAERSTTVHSMRRGCGEHDNLMTSPAGESPNHLYLHLEMSGVTSFDVRTRKPSEVHIATGVPMGWGDTLCCAPAACHQAVTSSELHIGDSSLGDGCESEE